MKKQALLIGINEYQILPELKYARQDAEAVEQALKQNYCFSDDEVMLLTDAKPGLFKPSNRRIIEKHLEKLAEQDLDLFIFGFWGHGLFRNGQRYFCPLDVISEDIEELGLSFDSLQRLLSNIRAKNTCMILDCCQKVHDRGEEDVLTADDQKFMENAARDIVLRRKETEPDFQSNVAILNSCKQGQAAYEWDSRKHGIFTAHLLDAMNRRFDSVAQIVSYISKNVEKTAMELGKTQTPFYKLEGDISLPVSDSPGSMSPVFVLPEKSQDAVIQKPVIEDINLDIAPRVIEQQQPAIQYKRITLPPLTDELLKLQAENQGILETIEQLKTYTHESLAQANAALEQAQAQFDAWKERRDRLWKDMPQSTRELLENAISNNPDCTEKDVKVPVDNLSYNQYFDFLEQFQCGKKFELAKRELERVERERKSKCSEAINKCKQKIEDNNARSKVYESSFIDKVIMTILPVMPGYEDVNAPFPEDQLLDPLRQLGKYNFNWQPDQIFNRTRELWAENRPCIIAKCEEEARIREDEARKREETARKLKAKERRFRILFRFSFVGLVLSFIGFLITLLVFHGPDIITAIIILSAPWYILHLIQKDVYPLPLMITINALYLFVMFSICWLDGLLKGSVSNTFASGLLGAWIISTLLFGVSFLIISIVLYNLEKKKL